MSEEGIGIDVAGGGELVMALAAPIVEVRDREVLVLVVAVGKRDRNAVYRQADQR